MKRFMVRPVEISKGGSCYGGLGSIRSVWARHVAVRYVTAVKVIRVMLSHGVFRSVKLKQPR